MPPSFECAPHRVHTSTHVATSDGGNCVAPMLARAHPPTHSERKGVVAWSCRHAHCPGTVSELCCPCCVFPQFRPAARTRKMTLTTNASCSASATTRRQRRGRGSASAIGPGIEMICRMEDLLSLWHPVVLAFSALSGNRRLSATWRIRLRVRQSHCHRGLRTRKPSLYHTLHGTDRSVAWPWSRTRERTLCM